MGSRGGIGRARPELIWVGGSDWPEVTGLCQDLIHRHTRLHLHHADVF